MQADSGAVAFRCCDADLCERLRGLCRGCPVARGQAPGDGANVNRAASVFGGGEQPSADSPACMSLVRKPPMASEEFTVPSRVLHELVGAAEQSGVSKEDFLRAARVEPTWLETPDRHMSQGEVMRIAELALELTRDPALGLHCGERSSEGTFDVLSHLLAHASTLRQAFETLFRFSELVAENFPLMLTEAGDEAELHHRDSDDQPLPVRRLVAEWAVVSLFRLVRHFDGARASGVRLACFRHQAPDHHAEYARIFDGIARFDQPFTGLVLSRSLLDAPSPWRDEELCSTLSGLAVRRLQRRKHQRPYFLQVRDLLLQRRAPHLVGVPQAARELGISARSLHRRLSEEGRTYTELSHEASGHVAKRLLVDKQLTIKEVAYAMGFANASSFHRAFRRWTGMTPGVCKCKH